MSWVKKAFYKGVESKWYPSSAYTGYTIGFKRLFINITPKIKQTHHHNFILRLMIPIYLYT
ncbi:hypothetical protein AYK25_01700 [Thermoplasmatales archaeon SM1-50]|nr:MAG: hypothetical protein AYK25_01700 [Thermoplasmatales archaeon SM1-50]